MDRMDREEERGRGLTASSPCGRRKKVELPALAAALALAGALARLVLHGLHVLRVERHRAAALALAVVLALALVLGRGRSAFALALACVLAVGTMALTRVEALTNVHVDRLARILLGGDGSLLVRKCLAAGHHPSGDRAHH